MGLVTSLRSVATASLFPWYPSTAAVASTAPSADSAMTAYSAFDWLQRLRSFRRFHVVISRVGRGAGRKKSATTAGARGAVKRPGCILVSIVLVKDGNRSNDFHNPNDKYTLPLGQLSRKFKVYRFNWWFASCHLTNVLIPFFFYFCWTSSLVICL